MRVMAMFSPEDPMSPPLLNPYGLARYVILIAGIALVLVLPLDWALPMGTRATQLGVEDANRMLPQLMRASVLFVMVVYIVLTGWNPGAHGFAPGGALGLFAVYMFLSVFFYPADLYGRLFTFVKSLLWMATAIASYRLVLGGYLTAAKIRIFAGVTVLIAAAYTIPFCLDPGRQIGQNADYSVLLWCFPLLLLLRPPMWASALSGLAAVAIFVTVKRGAILALLAGGLIYSALLIHLSSREHKARDLALVLLVMAVIVGGLLSQWENIEYRVERDLNRGDIGSGRSWFYQAIIATWYDSDVFAFLFGRGFLTVPDTLEQYGPRIYAHSDWLEALHDMGVAGVVLFGYLHLQLLSLVIRSVRWRIPVAPALAMGYTVFVLRNLYSQCVIATVDTVHFGVLLGAATAFIMNPGALPARFFPEHVPIQGDYLVEGYART